MTASPTYARGGGEAGEVQTCRLGALVTAADLTAAFRAAGEETWLPVPSLEGRYEASSLGRVRRAETQRVRTSPVGVWGYPQITFRMAGGKFVTRSVHSLVAEAFHGPLPEGMEVRHLDGDPLNNAVDNLKYGTHSENERDKVRHGTHSTANPTKCPQGHPYSPENIYVSGGRRRCRICFRAQMDRQNAKARAKRAAAAVVREVPAAWTSTTTTAGVLGVIAAAYGFAVVTRALGLLLLTLSYGGH